VWMMRWLVSLAVLLSAARAEVDEPAGKALVRAMDTVIGKQLAWHDWPKWSNTMRQFFAENFTYEFAAPNATYHSIREWYDGEHVHWNEAFPSTKFAGTVGLIFAGNNEAVTLITYAQANFEKDFYGIPAPSDHRRVVVADLDFYRIADGRIQWNGCMSDLYGVMVQAGFRLLPKPLLPEGILYPARTMTGMPAPESKWVSAAQTARSEVLFRQSLKEDWVQGGGELSLWSDAAILFGQYGIGMAQGKGQILEHIIHPLHAAFVDRSYDIDTIVCEGPICGAHGFLKATHVAPWLGQAPQNGMQERVRLRMAVQYNFEGDRVLDAYVTFDIPDVMRQMGRDLFKELQQPKEMILMM